MTHDSPFLLLLPRDAACLCNSVSCCLSFPLDSCNFWFLAHIVFVDVLHLSRKILSDISFSVRSMSLSIALMQSTLMRCTWASCSSMVPTITLTTSSCWPAPGTIATDVVLRGVMVEGERELETRRWDMRSRNQSVAAEGVTLLASAVGTSGRPPKRGCGDVRTRSHGTTEVGNSCHFGRSPAGPNCWKGTYLSPTARLENSIEASVAVAGQKLRVGGDDGGPQ